MTDINVDSMQQLQTPSNYGFSAVGLDQLGATEYTLASIVLDVSGSVSGFARQLEQCVKTIVGSCKSSPRSDNLLLRLVAFNHDVSEVHGFRLLADIDPKEYDNTLNPDGSTALYDAVVSATEATNTLGETLVNQDYTANGVVYIVTDGCDNASTETQNSIKNLLARVARNEKLQSVAVILIMVGYADSGVKRTLDNFVSTVGITQFVDMTDLFTKANPEKALAKLAGYISRSISSTSQALASGSSTAASSQLTI